MSIKIDYREHEMLSYMKDKYPHINIETTNLQVGDIMIGGETDELIFERKTIADLAASIKDSRYHEQKQRLKSVYPFHRITYIIEGSISQLMKNEMMYGMSTKTLLSALISSQYRDGFHMIQTDNMEGTVWYLLEIASRLGEKTIFDTEVKVDYVSTLKVKSKKIDNITPDVCYLMQLSQLPGISMKIAKDISTIYPTMSSLLHAIQEHGIKAFISISGLGVKRAQTIIDYIL
jgi:crossover junction endonuclease MUS81